MILACNVVTATAGDRGAEECSGRDYTGDDAVTVETVYSDCILRRRQYDSPAARLLMTDPLFLRHLEMFISKPNKRHFHELRNRAKTLRRQVGPPGSQ